MFFLYEIVLLEAPLKFKLGTRSTKFAVKICILCGQINLIEPLFKITNTE